MVEDGSHLLYKLMRARGGLQYCCALFCWVSHKQGPTSWQLLLHFVLLFALFISLFLHLCKELLNQFTRSQVWEELVLLRNCLSHPWRLPLSQSTAPNAMAAACDEARRPHSFKSADSDMQDIHNFSFQAVQCHSSTCVALPSTMVPIRCPFPHPRVLTCISIENAELFSKQIVMK